jgi:glycosyltransferase involved in cell wall biosynthesis
MPVKAAWLPMHKVAARKQPVGSQRELQSATGTGHILHVFPTFGRGGAQTRVASIINALGSRLLHTIIALDGNHEAGISLPQDAPVAYAKAPRAQGSLGQILAFASLIRSSRPDLVVTYNWGAMDAVAGARLAGVCPVIHTEDGFGADEAEKLKTRRVIMRRLLLNSIFTTVVPSRTLEAIAIERFKLQTAKIRLILNGIDTTRFCPGRSEGLRFQLSIPQDHIVIGAVGQLRPEKNLLMLLRAFEPIAARKATLLIVGSGPCRRELEQMVNERGLKASVIFAGAITDPRPYYQAMDIFAMTSLTEQMPMALLEAMSTGLPAVCTAVGDIPGMLEANSAELVQSGDDRGYASALALMTERQHVRETIGNKNRRRCIAHYSLDRMMAEYARLYQNAIRREPACIRDLSSVPNA